MDINLQAPKQRESLKYRQESIHAKLGQIAVCYTRTYCS